MQKQAENLEELVLVVDAQNNIVGEAKRADMREKGLWHRATYIFLYNPNTQKLYIHLRHKDKKWAGDHWTTVFGGCVAVGEDYDSNAVKELAEEAGVQADSINPIFDFSYENDEGKQHVWGRAYLAIYAHEDALRVQVEEVQKYEEATIQEILERRKTQKFAEDSNKAFDLFVEKISKGEIKLGIQ